MKRTTMLLALLSVASARVVPVPAAKLLPYPPMHWHSWNVFTGENRRGLYCHYVIVDVHS
jgi:hypothetical protein